MHVDDPEELWLYRGSPPAQDATQSLERQQARGSLPGLVAKATAVEGEVSCLGTLP